LASAQAVPGSKATVPWAAAFTPGAGKVWASNAFELEIDDLDCTRVAKIEGFSIAQNVGIVDGLPKLVAKPKTLPKLVFYAHLATMSQFNTWYAGGEIKGGRLLFLSTNKKDVFFGLKLLRLKVLGVANEPGAGGLARAKIETSVGEMQ